MKRMPPLKLVRLLVVALFIAGVVFSVGTVLMAKWELGGSHPDRQTLGATVDISQRAMTQYCTGVIVTPEATWLVGRREGQVADFPFLQGVPDVSAAMTGAVASAPASAEAASGGLFRAFGIGGDDEVTIVSRLGPKGVFEPVAWLPDSACLHPTPDGKRLFLLTGLSRPSGEDSSTAPSQLAIFQSDDQGRSWLWRKAGLFPDNGLIAWSLNPYFYDALSVWAWRQLEDSGPEQAPSGAATAVASGLQHSADGGTVVVDVLTSEPLPLHADQARMRLKSGAIWGESNGSFGEMKRHVLQLDADHAVAWVSQVFDYTDSHTADAPSHSLNLTSHALLHREGGRWRMGGIQRQEGLAIERLFDTRAGPVVALGHTSDSAEMKVLLLNKDGLRWEARGSLPGAFGMLTDHTGLREAFAGRNAMVVNVMSEHVMPWWIAPWRSRRPNVSANAVFYSTDWGASWHRLAIDGYLGVMGLDAGRDRVFWGQGNWYSSRDLNVYSDGLSSK